MVDINEFLTTKQTIEKFLWSKTLPKINPSVISWSQFGSQLIKNATKPYSDFDYLILCSDAFKEHLFTQCSILFHSTKDPEYIDGGFETYRDAKSGKFNLVTTTDPLWYKKSLTAQKLCEKYGIVDKIHRISLFEAIKEGQWK